MKTIAVEEGAHSELGPSSADRWLNCPASVAATRGLPDRPTQYAIEGTAAHTVSEWVRERGVPAASFIGTTVRVTRGASHHDVVVDREFAASVQEFCGKVGEFAGHELVEGRVSYEAFVPGGFGTLDSAKLTFGLGRITDFKFGTGVKKWAKMNPQLMTYALGVLIEWDYLFGFEKFVLAISQPRLGHYDEWEISRADLLGWAETVLKPGAVRTRDIDAPFAPGEWCQFCKLKATCRARAQSVFEAVVGEFDSLDSATEAVPAQIARATTLSNEELARLLGAVEQIKSWCRAVETHAESELRAGRAVGDFKFVSGRSVRKWKADAETVEQLWAKQGLQIEELYTEPELISPAQAEQIAGKKLFAPATERKEAGPLSGLIGKSQGKPTVVRGTDPRPALSIAELEGFVELGVE